jgi:signal peptidase II
MQKLTRLLLVVALLLGCVGCDRAAKVVAKAHLSEGPTISLLHDAVRLTYAENPGAFLGLGASLSEIMRAVIFQGAISLIVIGLVLSAAFWPRLTRVQVIALTLLGASGLGNLIDRLLYDGRVTDFLNIGIGGIRTGIFNIADILGVVAVGLLLVFRNVAAPHDSAL